MRDTPDVLALRYFLEVARLESMSGAARALGVTQPAVSRQVRALERSLGATLLNRHGRSVRLTEAGHAVQKQASAIVEQVEMLPDVVSAASREPAGRLVLGVPYTFGDFLVPPMLKRFAARYPKVRLSIVQGYSGEITNLLSKGELDVGLLYGSSRNPEIELVPLIQNELGLVAPAVRHAPEIRGRQFLLADVLALPLILPSRSHGLRELIEDAAGRAGRTLQVAVEVDNPVLAKALVREGLGFMLLAYSGGVREFKAGNLRFFPIVSPRLKWPLSIGTNKTRPPSLARAELIREIVSTTERGLRRSAWRAERIVASTAV